MKDTAVVAILLAAGLVHLLPVAGVLGGRHLQTLYGVSVEDPAMSLLLRHRAVLFALVGAAMIGAAVWPPARLVGVVVGVVSLGSFLLLAMLTGPTTPALARVFRIDVVLLPLLLVALGLVLRKGG